MTPKRIQIRRVKGWRMPAGAVHVGRPSRWGNPFVISVNRTRQQAIDDFRAALLAGRLQSSVEQVRRELGGKDLACWCRLDQACHADILLEVANSAVECPLPLR
jgi:hypothetical protein